jgi:hypothetical protein
VQVTVMVCALISHRFGLSHSSGFVLTEWLSMEQVDVHDPSNFGGGGGPRLADLVRLGAPFAPFMRSDFSLVSRLKEKREKESNFTGCCVMNNRSGCVDLG